MPSSTVIFPLRCSSKMKRELLSFSNTSGLGGMSSTILFLLNTFFHSPVFTDRTIPGEQDKGPFSEIISISLPPNVVCLLTQYAEEHKITSSKAMRIAIQHGLYS